MALSALPATVTKATNNMRMLTMLQQRIKKGVKNAWRNLQVATAIPQSPLPVLLSLLGFLIGVDTPSSLAPT
jgi:hypothetical protein